MIWNNDDDDDDGEGKESDLAWAKSHMHECGWNCDLFSLGCIDIGIIDYWSIDWLICLFDLSLPFLALVAVVVCFFVCWAPFHAQRLMAIYVKDPTDAEVMAYNVLLYISGVTYYVSATCKYSFLSFHFWYKLHVSRSCHWFIFAGLFDFAGNPILYSIMSAKFRDAFKQTFTQCGRCKRWSASDIDWLWPIYRLSSDRAGHPLDWTYRPRRIIADRSGNLSQSPPIWIIGTQASGWRGETERDGMTFDSYRQKRLLIIDTPVDIRWHSRDWIWQLNNPSILIQYTSSSIPSSSLFNAHSSIIWFIHRHHHHHHRLIIDWSWVLHPPIARLILIHDHVILFDLMWRVQNGQWIITVFLSLPKSTHHLYI